MPSRDLIRAVWDGRVLIPDGNRSIAAVHDRFGEGEVVTIELDPDRSRQTHNHYFACIKTAWDNLPEQIVSVPFAVSPETLRSHALCAMGYCDTEVIACGSEARAQETAAYLSRMAVRFKGYALTEINGTLVTCHTPKSQSMKAMGREDFQDSKRAVLQYLADLIGVAVSDLTRTAKERAA